MEIQTENDDDYDEGDYGFEECISRAMNLQKFNWKMIFIKICFYKNYFSENIWVQYPKNCLKYRVNPCLHYLMIQEK